MKIARRRFRDASLRNKIMLLILFISGTVLILSSLLFFIYDSISYRKSLKGKLFIVADIIGNNAMPALLFNDEKAASDSLSSIKADNHVIAAYIITPDFKIFARQVTQNAERNGMHLEKETQAGSIEIDRTVLAQIAKESASSWNWDFDINIVRDIEQGGKKIGMVVIQSDTKELTTRMLWFGASLAAITSLMFYLVILLSARLQTVISRPVILIADAMKAVSAGKVDYSIRVTKESKDELGDLADGFNEMITRIQTSDQEVQMHRGHLEEEVARRTYDLERAYDQLTRELNERKRTEEALRLSESKLAEAQHIAHIGSWEWNLADNSMIWSDEVFFILGAERGSQNSCHDEFLKSVHHDDLVMRNKAIRDAMEIRAPYTIDYRIVLPNATLRYIREQGNVYVDAENRPFQIKGTFQDITEHRKLEEQLRHAQKMEAIGQLAGGIAHDFNNILTAIMGYGNLMIMHMKKDDPLVQHLEQILEASDKAAGLTRSLLAFSRKQIMKLTPVDLNEVIRKVEKFLMRIIREDIELKTQLTDRELPVLVDTGQIEQVLMNLATNARDAMPFGGTLNIGTELVAVSGDPSVTGLQKKKGKYALITVSDTGQGMDSNTLEKIFEPFFTTKEMGRGTGLGLSIIDGIIAQHNGNITVVSEVGHGTTFNIYLPLNQAETERPEIHAAAEKTPRGGSETVLLAEDDEAVRKLGASLLTEFGYHVLLATDGEDAIRQFMNNRETIDLAILDMIMPKKNGKEVYDVIREIRADVKVLFSSGYTADIIHKEGILDSELDFVMKPVSPIELLKKVREILDR